jgi:hypothetical protein
MADLLTINIPDLGEVEEAEVIEICVEIGQKVESEDPIMVLETDKAAMGLLKLSRSQLEIWQKLECLLLI